MQRSVIAMCGFFVAAAASAQLVAPLPPDTPAPAQRQSPFAALIGQYLHLDSTGHSPTPEDIAAMATLQPRPDAAAVADAIPSLLKCLDNSDVALRTFALSAITGLEAPPEVPPNATLPATAPNAYKADVAPASRAHRSAACGPPDGGVARQSPARRAGSRRLYA